jgi:hypothetical protein
MRMRKLKPHPSGAPMAAATRSLVIKYAADGAERIFIVSVLGKSGNLLWAIHDGSVQVYLRKRILRMVSIQTTQEIDWKDVRV